MRPIVPWLLGRGAILRPRILNSIFHQNQACCWLSTTAHDKQTKPLRILFCGSDTFSARSLTALCDESKSADSNILSIDVVTWKDKYGGRNNATLRSPFIKNVALKKGLPLHQIDTFDDWQTPVYNSSFNSEINLVIAVSFGLLIPMRIINGAAYGGLNVHPSMLPDLRGAAPINWTIIRGLSHMGVSLQTLHPTKFDHGVVLDQTPYPGIKIPRPDTVTVELLKAMLAELGSVMLVNAIRNKLYVPPYVPVPASLDKRELTKAPKIVQNTRAVDFQTMSRDAILRLARGIQPLTLVAGATPVGGTESIPMIISKWMRLPTSHDIPSELQDEFLSIPKGVPYTFIHRNFNIHECEEPLFINVTPDRIGGPSQLVITEITFRSKPEEAAAKAAAKSKLFDEPTILGPYLVYRFANPLAKVWLRGSSNADTGVLKS